MMARARKARNPHPLLIPLRLALDLSSILFANTPTYEIEAMPCETLLKITPVSSAPHNFGIVDGCPADATQRRQCLLHKIENMQLWHIEPRVEWEGTTVNHQDLDIHHEQEHLTRWQDIK
jgi:hypothetical protein